MKTLYLILFGASVGSIYYHVIDTWRLPTIWLPLVCAAVSLALALTVKGAKP